LASHLQHTLKTQVSFSGVGIHSGQSLNVTISPGAADSGVVFLRRDVSDRDPRIPARADHVVETRLGTVLGNSGGVTVSTVEHLMAVLCALCVDNAVVSVDGPEIPIMDGSCDPFVRIIDSVGLRAQQARRAYIEVVEPVVITDGDKRASLAPADRFEVAFEILFDVAAIGRQRIDLSVDESSFRRQLSNSRTFGFLHEVEALRAAGLARGGNLDNVVVIDKGAVLNPQGLRRGDEFVRHKALDAIGDLYLLGAPLLGRYEGIYAGHALNNALARALLSRPSAWRKSFAPERLARAV
jgi:UDP-3-O-[3-hydroxymyristoyl] N-acetylglucosamine deacetylase